MATLARRVFAMASVCGLAVSIWAYLASYAGTTMEDVSSLVIVLSVGAFAILVPIYVLEFHSVRRGEFFWRDFSIGRPKWAVPAIKLIGSFFCLHFIWFLIESHLGSPEYQNGKYLLDANGNTIRELTKQAYLALKGWELRVFATGWLFFYFVPLMYWSFPRHRGLRQEPREST